MNIGETIRVFRAEPVVSPLPGDPPWTPADDVRVQAGPEAVPVELEPSSPGPLGG